MPDHLWRRRAVLLPGLGLGLKLGRLLRGVVLRGVVLRVLLLP